MAVPNIGQFNRRRVLKGVGTTLGVLALRGFSVQANEAAHFTHGVASGDPLSDKVILWTRVIPGSGNHSEVEAIWQVALDADFTQVVSSGVATSSKTNDYTLKVDASGLPPNGSFFYRFIVAGKSSPIGRTKTLPLGSVDQYKIGVASCSNYPQGYFNAYKHMAESDLDLVLHLGDYIYEYADGRYANRVALEQLGRNVQPPNEILSIEDYRMRYGLYRTDPDLMAVHHRHPFICVWDDHELTNNTWKGGAENHNEGEGDFDQRMRAARQAYHEWLPIRTTSHGGQAAIYRSFQIGDLADLHMLDTRLHGRDRGLEYAKDLTYRTVSFNISDIRSPKIISSAQAALLQEAQVQRLRVPFDLSSGKPEAITDYEKIVHLDPKVLPKGWSYLPDAETFRSEKLDNPQRTILGFDQEDWLANKLVAGQARGSKWQIIGQQVLMGRTGIPNLMLDLEGKPKEYVDFVRQLQSLEKLGLPFNLDAWDGYPACRQRVFEQLINNACNPIVLAGDTHNAWVFNLADDNGRAVGVEIGTPGISSPGMESDTSTIPEQLAAAFKKASTELVDLDTSHRGWAEVTLTPAQMTNQWHFVDTILQRDFNVTSSQLHVCEAGQRKFRSS
jgi:alkaline phosphatase D